VPATFADRSRNLIRSTFLADHVHQGNGGPKAELPSGAARPNGIDWLVIAPGESSWKGHKAESANTPRVTIR